jgi:hypothetical protein
VIAVFLPGELRGRVYRGRALAERVHTPFPLVVAPLVGSAERTATDGSNRVLTGPTHRLTPLVCIRMYDLFSDLNL